MTRCELVVGILAAFVLAGSAQTTESRMAPVDPVSAAELDPIQAKGELATIGIFRPAGEFLFSDAVINFSERRAIWHTDELRGLVRNDQREIRHRQAGDTAVYGRVPNTVVVQCGSVT